jgi:hypothetical protein
MKGSSDIFAATGVHAGTFRPYFVEGHVILL